jgi:hypothetical protein
MSRTTKGCDVGVVALELATRWHREIVWIDHIDPSSPHTFASWHHACRSPRRKVLSRAGLSASERAHPIESGAVAMELHALEFVGERAETFVRGRAAGVEAARRHGPVPDRVADAIATIITGDPAVRAAG